MQEKAPEYEDKIDVIMKNGASDAVHIAEMMRKAQEVTRLPCLYLAIWLSVLSTSGCEHVCVLSASMRLAMHIFMCSLDLFSGVARCVKSSTCNLAISWLA